MPLKQRAIDPIYFSEAKGYFALIHSKQNEYHDYFFNHPIFPANNYQKEHARIINEWKNRTSPGGMRSEAKDLENLYTAYESVRLQQNLKHSVIDSLFARVYGYFSDMARDFEVGYLEDDKFNEYLLEYNTAIEKNKQLKLECWDKQAHKEIEKKINQLLLK